MSFMATYAAALAAYAHLHHSLLNTQSPARVAWHVCIFFLIPIFPILYWIVSAFFTALYYHRTRKRRLGHVRSSRGDPAAAESTVGAPSARIDSFSAGFSHPKLWLARATGVHVEFSRKTSKPLWRAGTLRNLKSKSKEQSKVIRFGQLLVVLFVSIQCSGAFIRGVRRIGHGKEAATLADVKMFWMSLSALFIVAQSVIVIALNRAYTIDEPEEIGLADRHPPTNDAEHRGVSGATASLQQAAVEEQAPMVAAGDAQDLGSHAAQIAVNEERAAPSVRPQPDPDAYVATTEFLVCALVILAVSLIAFVDPPASYPGWLASATFHTHTDLLIVYGVFVGLLIMTGLLEAGFGGTYDEFLGFLIFASVGLFMYHSNIRCQLGPVSSISSAFSTDEGLPWPVNRTCPQLWKDEFWAPGF